MTYAERFRTGLDWLDENADVPARRVVLTAVYAAIYDEHGRPDATQALLRAYDDLRNAEADYADKELHTVYLQGKEAETFAMKVYVQSATALARRAGMIAEDDDTAQVEARLIEGWSWPDSLPYAYPIPRGLLRSVAKRIASADIYHLKEIQRYYAAHRAATEERTP